ncbi:hypothetical protein [Ruegeria jejuensis]|uniref:hypothetical protein n=1 Tax=Ruegeria jejuensis TaxID=3233338 RepID=UPI00355C5C39
MNDLSTFVCPAVDVCCLVRDLDVFPAWRKLTKFQTNLVSEIADGHDVLLDQLDMTA